MKLHSLSAMPFAIGALVAGMTMSAALQAAPPPKPLPILSLPVTIYSDTFTPAMRIPDMQAMQNVRYFVGPGMSPNLLYKFEGSTSGTDAFFNTPDLAIGSTPMSVVSAEVCLQVFDDGIEETPAPTALLMFGVQDKDRNFTLWENPAPLNGDALYGKVVGPSDTQVCETLTFSQPVKLVNHPHIVLVIMFDSLQADNAVDLDGVKYTLMPSLEGDLNPGEGMVPGAVPNWFNAR